MRWFAGILFLLLAAGCGGMEEEEQVEGAGALLQSLVADCRWPVQDQIPFGPDRMDEIPDYLQTDTTYGLLPGRGRQYCAPAAVSNSLMWLAANGYSRLRNGSGDPGMDQFEMVRDLGADYFRTDPDSGTSVYYLLNGVQEYLRDRGYHGETLLYLGWHYHAPEFASGIEIPRPACLSGAIASGHSVWLHVGFYDYDPVENIYLRVGAHMVTGVGFGFDGGESTGRLILHDPAPGAGLSFSNDVVYPREIATGTLQGPYYGLPRSAEGYFRLDGIALPSNAELAILDGAVLLAMPPVGQ